jgi:hypothetical protein
MDIESGQEFSANKTHLLREEGGREREKHKKAYNGLDLGVPPSFLFDVLCRVLVLHVCHPEDSSTRNCAKTLENPGTLKPVL